MTTDNSPIPDSLEASTLQLDIAPASLLTRIMMICMGVNAVVVLINFFLFIASGEPALLVTSIMSLICSGTLFIGWQLARHNRTAAAALMLSIINCIAAVGFIRVTYLMLPLALSLIMSGVLIAMPYLSVRAFRYTIIYSSGVTVLVGLMYIYNQPAETLVDFLARTFIFVSCLLIVLIMGYLVYRSSVWMHTVVRDMDQANAALRNVHAGLEQTVQRRTSELTQSNEALLHEIDERRRVEEQLRAQNAFLETLHDTSLGIVNRLDMQELLQSILAKASALMNIEDAYLDLYDSDAMTNRCVASYGLFYLSGSEQFKPGVGLIGKVWKLGRTVVVEDYATWENRLPSPANDLFHAMVGVPLFVDGAVFGIIGVVRTTLGHVFSQQEVALLERFASLASIALDNAQLYETVRANEQALETRVQQRTRELTVALEENDMLRAQAVKAAMAEERSRLARDLHDSVSQAIYGIVLGTRTLEQLLADRKPADEQLNQVVDYIISLADAALTEMRALIFELRPESLQQEGVLVAFRKQCDVLQVRYGLKIELQTCDSEPDIPIEMKEAFYRIAIEATHNVVKHAGARRITLSFYPIDGAYRLRIIDDGRGFDMNGVAPGRLGLKTMRERAEKLHGTIQMRSSPGNGTEMQIDIPMPVLQPVLS